MAKKKDAVQAIEYLKKPSGAPPPVCVVFGQESFLKREIIANLRQQVLGDDDGQFSFSLFSGASAEPYEVFDALATVSLFGSEQRLVLVEEADDFVKRQRSVLEDYVVRPHRGGVVVLDVKTWPKNTRLYKQLAEHGLQIECKTPSPTQLLKWLIDRAQSKHGVSLRPSAAELLLDWVEPELGLLDQELAKLALLVEPHSEIDESLVQANVGSWRTQTTWDLIDAAADGNAAEALKQLDRLLLAGEHPVALFGQIASTFRRFTAATRLIEDAERTKRRMTLAIALEQAGFKPFVIRKAERQLKQLGRHRGGQLLSWLLAADLALKGEQSAPAARLVLEQFIVRLAAVDALRSGTHVGHFRRK